MARWFSGVLTLDFAVAPRFELIFGASALNTHNAPQVVYPLGRSVFLGAALIVIGLTSAAVVGFWIASAPVAGWRLWLTLAVFLASFIAAARGWRAAPVGYLNWDGQLWRWQSRSYLTGESNVQLQVALDFQAALWLRLENSDGAVLWVWAERSALPYLWMDLRRAVYSPVHAQGAPLAVALATSA